MLRKTRMKVLWAFVSVVRKGTYFFFFFSMKGSPLYLSAWRKNILGRETSKGNGLRQNECERTLCYTMKVIL